MTDEAYPDALPVGYRLHWYLLEQVLGQGGFGITYLARDTNLDRLVAIKEYLPSEIARRRSDAAAHPRTEAQAERFGWGLERFLAEARTLARFDHPNIVRVNSVFEANNTAYMVMRFEEGESLAQLLERHDTLTERQLINGLFPILDGLQLVHSAGYIHRDIKPDNIYLRQDGSAVLLDFGSARQSFGNSKSMTVLVAPGYAPLEQYYSDAATQGAWTDIYSLGATCYRAISGRAPLDAIVRAKGVLGSAREVLPPAVEVGRGRYSERLLAAVDHALQLRERDRPQSIAEWRRELEPAGGVPLGPTPTPELQSANPPAGQMAPPAPVAAPASPVAVAAPADSSSPRPSRALWPAAAASVALAGVAALFVALRAPGRPADTVSSAVPASGPAGVAESAVIPIPPASAPVPGPSTAPRPVVVTEAPVAIRAGPSPATALLISATPPVARPPAVASIAPPVSVPVARPAPLPAPETAPSHGVPDENTPPPAPSLGPVPAPMQKDAAPPAFRNDQLNAAEAALQRGDRTQAIKLLTPWADAGSTRAQLLLAKTQEGRPGHEGSDFQAYIWYSIAARRSEAGASDLRDRVAARLQPVEIKQANQVVERWRPGPEPAAKANP